MNATATETAQLPAVGEYVKWFCDNAGGTGVVTAVRESDGSITINDLREPTWEARLMPYEYERYENPDEIARSVEETGQHIEIVRRRMRQVVTELERRARAHDGSKLDRPELPVYASVTPRFAGVTYGSEEYRQVVRDLGPALDHHHRYNDHHPEHFVGGVSGMDLFQLTEMFCDWLAASEREGAAAHIYRSIEINERTGKLSLEMARLLRNTADSFFRLKE